MYIVPTIYNVLLIIGSYVKMHIVDSDQINRWKENEDVSRKG